MEKHFKVGDKVAVGTNGRKGKVVNTYKPIGTYIMFKVQMFDTGEIVTAAKHELVKGMPDSDNEFEFLFECDETGDFHNPGPLPDLETRTPPVETSTTGRSACNPESPPPTTATPACQTTRPQPMAPPHDKTTSRFVNMGENDLENFLHDQENKNTMKKTLSNINLLRNFLKSENETREIHSIPPDELNVHLAKFFVCVRQKDGSEYQPSYLRGMMGSFERYLKRHRYDTSIISGYQFYKTREALKCKQKELKKQGLGNRPQAADRIDDNEINMLYEKGQLGNNTPGSLLNTLWLNNTLYFGMRGGGMEHRSLCWGDIQLCYDTEMNMEYLTYNERQTKTRTGENVNNLRDKPRMYATQNKDRCPVETYKTFSDKRPSNFCEPDHPFYLAPVTNVSCPNPNAQWFLRGPVGRHKLSQLMQNMVKKCHDLDIQNRRLTNTSVRKHLCQKLLENNIPDTHAVHITGHKNPQSLNNYRTLNNVQRQTMSAILSNEITDRSSTLTSHSNDHTYVSSQLQQNHNEISLQSDPNEITRSIFHGSTITGGTFNIHVHNNYAHVSSENPAKRRRIIYDSDSD